MLTQEQQLDKDPTSIIGKYDDLAKLSLLTEDILLEHLKHRYERDLIYVSHSDFICKKSI
jgi:myosin heavy subunit